jgi:hypothetical protein
MLGHDALGRWALGQLPSAEAGAATAPGALLVLTLTLAAGAASGEGVLPPVSGFFPHRVGIAPGAWLHLGLSLRPGRAHGGVVNVDGTAGGARFAFATAVRAGGATGDAIGYDNDLALLLAA